LIGLEPPNDSHSHISRPNTDRLKITIAAI
jgi:hypothetical protein